MNLHCSIFGTGLIIAGIYFWTGKGILRIKGFLDQSAQVPQEMNLIQLSRLLASVFLSAGLIFSVAGINEAFLKSAFIWCMIGWFILTGFAVYLLSKKRIGYTKTNQYRSTRRQ